MSVSTPDIFAHPSLKRSNVNPHFKAFRQNTSLHGVKYICDPSRHWIERCFWCLVVASCIISLYAIYQMKMSQWRETPMTIEVSHVPQHISTLPVPALTVCGSLSLSNETVETFLNNTGYDFNFLKNIADTLGMAIEAFDKEYNMTSDCGKRFILSDSILQSILHHVNFKNNLVSIIDYAEPLMCFATYTFRGLCMSCNMAPPSKIYKIDSVRNFLRDDNERYGPKQLDIEYKSELKSDAIHGFPSFQVDRKDSQNISSWQKPKYPPLVRNPSIEYFFHTYLKSTYKDSVTPVFTIHNAWDIPSPFMRWHHLNKFNSFRMNVEPELILHYPKDDGDFLYNVEPIRQCYTTTDKTLDYFQYYTYQNCLIECSTKRALRDCGCVLFYMPHNESTYICSHEDSYCALNIASNSFYNTNNGRHSCNCLPSCNFTEYKVISFESYPDDTITTFHTIINHFEIVFRDIFFLPKIRTYTYNNYKMIDATVVYLDVFLGISLMTMTEIFYYLLLYVIDYLKVKLGKSL